ncbi:hypothetical protein, partial [Polaribacter tangerinus]
MKYLFPILFFFTVSISFAQKEANFWYFGNNAALDFNSGKPVPVNGSSLSTLEGCSSFSDVNGNLLFYVGAPSTNSKNLTVWDKNNSPMPNGVGLQGDASSSQAALTVPAPGKPNIYYLFTVGARSSDNAGFWYYTIDMSANGGNGDVVAGPVSLGSVVNHVNWSEKVTAVRAKECNAFWVISTFFDTFYAYKVDNSGVNINNPTISKVPTYSSQDPRGYLKVSPDGTTLVAGNMPEGAFIFDFDDQTGKVTNFKNSTITNRINIFDNVYGVEFSPSSSRLYLSTGNFRDANESLYQIDLTKPTIEEINESIYLIHTYFNSRGALQLGPDGKIYWTSNQSNFISVINRPEQLKDACNYSHLSVKVGEGAVTASQGLPPFLSSLLLPIEIKDKETNEVINFKDLQFCIGENKTITPEKVTGTDIIYEWAFDNGTTKTILSAAAPDYKLNLNNISTADIGAYTLKINLKDECGNDIEYNGTFNVDVFEAAKANSTNIPPVCDEDNDGFNTFDLRALTASEILGTANPANFEILYFDDLAKATIGVDTIPSNYKNLTSFGSQTIYARVQNKKAPSACYDITDFNLIVTELPIATQPEPYRICDNLESGDDTDGIINTFVLNTRDSEILGSLPSSQFNVSYHTSLAGAETNDSSTIINKDTDYSVTNNTTVFIRVENINNADCYDASKTIELIVDPLPVIKPNPVFNHCVSDTDTSTTTTVNLTLAETSISESAGISFEYFEDNLGTTKITNITSYAIPINTSKTVYAKVTTSFGCTRDIVSLTINVGATSDNAYNTIQTPVCDDFLAPNGDDNPSLNNDTDNISAFTLDKTAILSGINAPANTTVSFFENKDDRSSSLNEIDISNFRNDISKNEVTTTTQGIQFPIYYKILSNVNNDCQGLGQFYVQINSVPIANAAENLTLCDDAVSGLSTDGFVDGFMLTDNDARILGSSQSPSDFEVTYHKSAEEANSGSNPLA